MLHRRGPAPFLRSRAVPLRPLARRGAVMLALATALAAALAAAMLRPATSEAASTPPPPKPPAAQAVALADDVTWAPGDDVSWEYLPDKDQCITTQSATVTTSTPDQATQLVEALQSEGPKTDFPAETGILDVHVNVSGTANGPETGSTKVDMVIHSYIAKEQCEAAVTPAPGTPAPGATAPDSTAAATPDGLAPADTSRLVSGRFGTTATWYKGALVGLLAAVFYIGVSVLTVSTITVLAGAAGTTVSAALVGAAAGCLGGATAGALTTILVNSDDLDGQTVLSNAVGGCVVGAIAAAYPVRAVATGVAEDLLSVFGRGAPALVGDASVGAATSAGVEMTGLSQVVSTTTTALRAAS
jgi:hypothetical protein